MDNELQALGSKADKVMAHWGNVDEQLSNEHIGHCGLKYNKEWLSKESQMN